VWLGNNAGYHIVKFTRQGKFLLQIGRPGAKGQGSNDTGALMGPTGITVDPKTNEVYVADGYGNRRVIVFDADSGAYKRHWGAYGKKPDDTVPVQEVEYKPGAPPPQQFDTVHCVLIDKDDVVWVCDRANSRIQVFKKDGTFVREGWIAPPQEGIMPRLSAFTATSPKKTMLGSVFDLAFSRDAEQRFVFVADGRRERVWILRRIDMKTVGSIGQQGHWGGSFTLAHNLAVDSKNNLYVSESAGGSRVQRFLYKGLRAGS
jgi:DNA-binding beta-propeller fold protein YncE